MSRARAWLEITRISNLPTVVSNAIAGAAIGSIAILQRDFSTIGGSITTIGGALIVRSVEPSVAQFALLVPPFAYIGGMVLNDAFDAKVDARERPGRPIPSGRITQRSAFFIGFLFLFTALCFGWLADSMSTFVASTLLVGAVTLYDFVHTRSAASAFLLALCRALAALVPMIAFTEGDLRLIATSGAFALPLTLALWTLGLSIVARHEISSLEDLRSVRCRTCDSLIRSGATLCVECGNRIESSAQPPRARWPQIFEPARLMTVAPLLIAGVFLVVLPSAAFANRDGISDSELGRWLRIGIPLAFAIVASWFAFRARLRLERDRRTTPSVVALWIALLALIDAIALAAVGQFLLATIAIGFSALTRRMQRSISGS